MLISDYLKLRNQQISVNPTNSASNITTDRISGEAHQSFAEALKEKLEESGGVDFSGHALKRLDSRNIDMLADDNKLERLNKGVELAAEKGSSDALVLVDSTAFIVSVKNNMVITTLSQDDLAGNVFTNIDSTVIM